VRVPDFFIIGAPKCGTNALYSYLKEHPQVYMPDLKEPQYFSRDFPDLAQVDSQDAYERLFAPAPAGAVLGEASVWYLYSDAAVPAIREANPAARFIAILRNPIDAAHSLHTQFLRSLKESEDDFETAWNLQEERRHGRKLPRYCPEPRCVQYQEAHSFGLQVQRLMERVPADQLKVLIFEEFLPMCGAGTASCWSSWGWSRMAGRSSRWPMRAGRRAVARSCDFSTARRRHCRATWWPIGAR